MGVMALGKSKKLKKSWGMLEAKDLDTTALRKGGRL